MNKEEMEFLIEFLKNPLVISLIIFFIGKYFWIDKYLLSNKASKDLNIKERIISKILLMEEKVKLSRMYYDRLIYTLKKIHKEDNEFEKSDLMKIFKQETDKISILINDSIPKLISEIESNIDIYFQNKEKNISNFEKYKNELKKINKFMVEELPGKITSLMKIKDFEELNLENFTNNQNNLIQEILATNTIWMD